VIALLFAILPLVERIPTVESIELNHMVCRERVDSSDWHTIGWRKQFCQVIVRGYHSGTKRIEIMGWTAGSMEHLRAEKDNGWWIVRTNSGPVRSRSLTMTYTDYDPEVEERERLPSEFRAGWPK
jgi:hypothetical protein